MRREIIMPKVGLDMEEGTIISWYKEVGDEVREGDVLFEVETDKSTTDVESEYTGKLVEIVVDEDETVDVTEVVAWIETND